MVDYSCKSKNIAGGRQTNWHYQLSLGLRESIAEPVSVLAYVGLA